MNARETILANIKNSLSRTESSFLTRDERLKSATRRLSTHPRGIVPDLTSKSRRSSLALFCEKVIASQASLKKVKSYNKAGPAILDYLRQNNLPMRMRTGNDKRLAKLSWGKNAKPELLIGASGGLDETCISHAIGGVSETGTLILVSGPENPSTLNFLPENHIIVINKKDIRKSHEGIWKMLRRKFGKGNLPRTVNMITGPSRSADIEQTLILGAHGPLRLHVIVVDEGG